MRTTISTLYTHRAVKVVKDPPAGWQTDGAGKRPTLSSPPSSPRQSSHEQVAREFVRVAAKSVLGHIRSFPCLHWIGGSQPSGQAPRILCEALSRRLGRLITPEDIGLSGGTRHSASILDWQADTLSALMDLGRVDLDMERRRLLGAATFSAAALMLPGQPWWTQMAHRGAERGRSQGPIVGRGDVEAVRETVAMFAQVDQRRGGGHARTAVVQYLISDVACFLQGTFTDEGVRREMFSAASELAYLSGWMAFDNSEHPIAQRYFAAAVKLAAEADDPSMAGHVLRAMAHQALDLGHLRAGLGLAAAAMEGERYGRASPRERALLGIVYAGRWPRPTKRAAAVAPSRPSRICRRRTTPSRIGCSSSARPAWPTRPPAPCATLVIYRGRSASSSTAFALGEPRPSPEPMPSRWDTSAPCWLARATSTRHAQRGPSHSTLWRASDPDAPARSRQTSAPPSRPCGAADCGRLPTWRRAPESTSVPSTKDDRIPSDSHEPKSGSVIAPSRSSVKPGLCAISQTWPSGSVKKPA